MSQIGQVATVSGETAITFGIAFDLEREYLFFLPEKPEDGSVAGGEGFRAWSVSLRQATAAELASTPPAPPRVHAAVKAAMPVRAEAVEPLPADHEANPAIRARLAERMSACPQDEAAARLWRAEYRDLAARAARQDDGFLRSLGRNDGEHDETLPVIFQRLRAEGLSTAGAIADDVLSDLRAERGRAERRALRDAEKSAAEKMIHTFPADGLVKIQIDRQPDLAGHASIFDMLRLPELAALAGSTVFYRTGGMAVPFQEALLLPGVAISQPTSFVGTRAQYDEARETLPNLFCELILGIQGRYNSRTEIAPEDLESPEGLRDPQRFFISTLAKEHIRQLVQTLCTAQRGACALLAAKSLWGICLCYWPYLSADDAIFFIESALRDWVERNNRSTITGPNGDQIPEPRVPGWWPSGIVPPSAVRGHVLRETFTSTDPPVWALGQLVRKPTPQEARAVKLQLCPDLADQVLASVLKGRKSVTSRLVWAEMKAADVTTSEVPDVDTRSWITKTLERLGWRRTERRLPDGHRERIFARDSLGPDEVEIPEPSAAEGDDEPKAPATVAVALAKHAIRGPMPMAPTNDGASILS